MSLTLTVIIDNMVQF